MAARISGRAKTDKEFVKTLCLTDGSVYDASMEAGAAKRANKSSPE
jgi:hypothetical protein